MIQLHGQTRRRAYNLSKHVGQSHTPQRTMLTGACQAAKRVSIARAAPFRNPRSLRRRQLGMVFVQETCTRAREELTAREHSCCVRRWRGIGEFRSCTRFGCGRSGAHRRETRLQQELDHMSSKGCAGKTQKKQSASGKLAECIMSQRILTLG